MTKKIISVILTLTLLAGICVETGLSAFAKTETHLYNGVAGEAVVADNESGDGYGFLYDFNKDGVKELVMTYVETYGLPVYYAVYTIKNGRPKKLCKRVLSDMGGACYKGVGVAKKGGKRYLVTYEDCGSGDVDYNTWRRVKVNYYKVTKSKIKKYKSAYYKGKYNNIANPVKVKKRTCKISGKKVSFGKYKKFLKSFKYSKIKRKYDSYWKYPTFRRNGAKSLKNLYWSL